MRDGDPVVTDPHGYAASVPREPSTERVREYYQRSAGRYDRSIRLSERLLRMDAGRRRMCAQAEGDVLEIAIGTGLNLPYFRDEGVHLTAIDVSPAMLDQARRRARDLGRDVELRIGDAQNLDFRDESFDAVVFGLCLCSIPDDARAVAEARRVLRPGGRILLLEHVRSPFPLFRVGQRLMAPLFLRFQSDHLVREPLDHLRAQGFAIEQVERWGWGVMERAVARKPEDDHRASPPH
jgi:ubiquinone/menaquinone biosynthesis C-methylase UbiE